MFDLKEETSEWNDATIENANSSCTSRTDIAAAEPQPFFFFFERKSGSASEMRHLSKVKSSKFARNKGQQREFISRSRDESVENLRLVASAAG